jgi:hypothetical protein
MLNAPAGVWLTFADYLDPTVRGETDPAKVMASTAVREFVQRLEREHGVPVLGLGVGGDGFKVAHLQKDAAGVDWSW